MIGGQTQSGDTGALATRMIVFTLIEMCLFYSVTANGLRRDVAVIGIIGAFAIALTARTQSRASVRSVAVLVTVLMLIAPLAIAFSHMTAAS
jgi:hypothetical protein